MAKNVFFLLVAVVLGVVVYLGLHHRGTSTTPPATSTTTPVATMAVKAYFLHDNALVPVVVRVPRSLAVAKAALAALLAGPPTGYETAVPADAKLNQVTLVGSAATAGFSPSLPSLTRTAQAQIVDTLTQFPTIQSVAIDAGTTPAALSDSVDHPLGRPATALDYADLTSAAPIFVRSPPRDSTVTSPVTVVGTAVAFEGSFVVEIHAGVRLVSTTTIDASVGAPERGTWSTTLDLPPGPVQLLFYEPSAEDGSHLHATQVDLTVSS
ncbi:MAG TPA: Gmad2 immunoglobulin-like domain-containing protein [Gaiellaceae bacterium]|nr:Gmad2 immunoglobulin-like domain-containing protein [Gaiellaceae bacterium]